MEHIIIVSPTVRRRIVVGLALLPLLLCVFGWAWSYAYTERIGYSGAAREWSAEIAVGELDLWFGAAVPPDSGWRYVHMHPDWEIGEIYAGLPDWHVLGFHFFWGVHPYYPGVTTVLLVLPFWMLSIAAGLVPALLWWKTRRHPDTRGFPVRGAEMEA